MEESREEGAEFELNVHTSKHLVEAHAMFGWMSIIIRENGAFNAMRKMYTKCSKHFRKYVRYLHNLVAYSNHTATSHFKERKHVENIKLDTR